ncbi:MAG: SDR family oxidoreductase [Solirubrobacterales bacterium]|nr:SDR family oxidoreductase [Solirubrobacterales bacterium]
MLSSGRTVLVTGGGGFIGSHLANRLRDDGHNVRILDNFATGSRENVRHLLEDVELIEGDMQSYERAHNAVRGCDVVFHQAALPSVPRSIQDPLTSNASNVIGTLNLLLAARDEGVRRFVFASSSSVYGANPQLPKVETMATLPISPYAVAKQAAEGYCRAFYEVYGLETVALRYFNVFGPRQDPLSQYAAVIPKFITSFLEGRPPIVYGDGEQSRDFTFIDNTVDANIRAASVDGVAGRAFNIACGERISLNDLLSKLRELTGSDLAAQYLDPRPGDIPHSLADISAAREILGFDPQVDLMEGLARTVEYHEKNDSIPAAEISANPDSAGGADFSHPGQ